MYGRVGLGKEMRYAIDSRYDLALQRLIFEPRYNLPPTKPIPLLYQRFFQCPGETADTKPAFRAAFKERRGVVMVDWFYEWMKLDVKRKQSYLIRRADGAPLLFAGLWESDDAASTAKILTITQNEFMAKVHNRMPVILEPEEIDRWVEGSAEEAKSLIAPAADGVLENFPVSQMVNNARVEDPRCAEPIPLA